MKQIWKRLKFLQFSKLKNSDSIAWLMILIQCFFFINSWCLFVNTCVFNMWTSLVTQTVKNRPAVQWFNPWIAVTCLQWPGFNPWIGNMPWRRKWQSIPVFLPGEFHGQRSLVGYSLWGRKELDMTEQLTHTLQCVVCSRLVWGFNHCIKHIHKTSGTSWWSRVKTRFFHCLGTGLIPGQVTRILHATQRGQKIER